MSLAADTSSQWQPVGQLAPDTLIDARLQLHHAAQIIVSAAISYLAPQRDDSHTNLEWLPDLKALATNLLPSRSGLRFALRPADLSLLSVLGTDTVHSSFALNGHRLPEALAWMSGELGREGFEPERLSTKKHYQIPVHPVADGAPFRLDPDGGSAELSRYYQDAWLVASVTETKEPGASPIRCWPHHFDLATLLTLPPAPDGTARTIGVGLSPGDDSYGEPYFYIGPNPHPAVEALVPLAVGIWHTRQWVGGVLTGTAITAVGSQAETQFEAARTFVDEAIRACRGAFG